jgi:hypothetical protein
VNIPLKPICLIIAILALCLYTYLCKAQSSTITERNIQYLDSLKVMYDDFCQDSVYSFGGHKKRKLKREYAVINFLNRVFTGNDSLPQLLQQLQRIRKVRIGSDSAFNGLIRTDKIVFNTDYSHVELFLESMDNLVYRKRFEIYCTPSSRCGNGHRVLDFQWFKEIWAPHFQAPLHVMDLIILQSEIWNERNIQQTATNHPDYIIKTNAPGDSSWINTIYANQFRKDSSCCYLSWRVEHPWKSLVKKDRWDVLKDLLYSPNYFMAIHAMEALIYGKDQQKVTLSNNDLQKIESLKKASYKITLQSTYDVFITLSSYRSIKTSDNTIINKYKMAVQ